MPGINRIKHPNSLIQRKVNFFIDYFYYVVAFNGLVPELEIDNLHAVLDKMVYQIEKNPNHAPIYIDNYLNKRFFTQKTYLKSFDKFGLFDLEIKKYRAITGKKALERKREFLQPGKSFFKSLKAFRREVKSKMFPSALRSVISFLKCGCPLEKHQKAIKFFTEILATELLFTRKSKADVDAFGKVFTKDFREFPYPKRINTDEKKAKYFQRKNFEKSFLAVEDYLKEQPSFAWIIFKVDGTLFPKQYIFMYNSVEIYSPHHKKLKKFREFTQENEFFKEIFGSYNYSLAFVPTKYHNLKLAQEEGVRQLEAVLIYLSSCLRRNCTVDKTNFAYTQDYVRFGYSLSGMPQNGLLDKFEIQTLEDNPFQILKNKEYKAKDYFLNHEIDYLRARNSKSIADYWRYLEVLLFDESDEKKVKQTVAGAMLLNEKGFRATYLRNHLRNRIGPFQSSHIDLGISIEEQVEFIKRKSNVNQLSKIIQSDFFKDVVSYTNKRFTKGYYRELYKYYTGIMTEVYEQRNMYEHRGELHESAAIKIDYTLPMIVMRLRWVLFDMMRKHPGKSFNELVEQIRREYQKVI